MYYVNSASVYAIGVIFPVLCITSVLLRFIARRRSNVGYGADDWTSVAALVTTCGCGAILLYGDAKHTIGWHNPPPNKGGQSFTSTNQTGILNAKLRFSFFPVSVVTIGLIRMTICLLYRRIFRGNAFAIVNWTTIGLIIGWVVAFVFASIFQCGSHLEAFWGSQKDYAQQCSGSFQIYAAMAVADVIIDIIILIIPIKPVIDLKMPSDRKMLVLLVFALGIFSIAAGMTRMILLAQLLTYPFGTDKRLFGLRGTTDPLGITGTILWWSYMEIGVGCLVSNMPAMVGFFRGHNNPLKLLMAQISRISLRSGSSNGSSGSKGSSTGVGSVNSRSEDQVESARPERSPVKVDNTYTDRMISSTSEQNSFVDPAP